MGGLIGSIKKSKDPQDENEGQPGNYINGNGLINPELLDPYDYYVERKQDNVYVLKNKTDEKQNITVTVVPVGDKVEY